MSLIRKCPTQHAWESYSSLWAFRVLFPVTLPEISPAFSIKQIAIPLNSTGNVPQFSCRWCSVLNKQPLQICCLCLTLLNQSITNCQFWVSNSFGTHDNLWFHSPFHKCMWLYTFLLLNLWTVASNVGGDLSHLINATRQVTPTDQYMYLPI